MKKNLLILVSLAFVLFSFTMDEDRPGYRWNPDTEQWVDIDECVEYYSICPNGSFCMNFPGTFKCIFTDGGSITDDCMGVTCPKSYCVGDSGVCWYGAIANGATCRECYNVHW